ncbi:MarR family winged helix-turn-helix transcriptional regulator [Aureimonas leprariae]|uniref:MarR family winged helix-turn-helix transcriptional regulator n=1 Tax=Plantimonas leprariae TaxID=2615207 RepID=UPI001AEE08DF|nr:MarR family winged helix-turn-helix transcriptional regulator [Aureimonas leprariae]
MSATPVPNAGVVPSLLSISKSIRQLLNISLVELELAAGQDQLLLCLADNGDTYVTEAAQQLSVRMSTISKMADILCGKGWVTKGVYIEDQRRVRLRLTEKGEHCGRCPPSSLPTGA